MANNKVIYGNTTIMDITDTTAEAADVAADKVFYGRDGVRTVGTGNYMDKVTNPTADDILVTDANGQAVDSGVTIDELRDMFIATRNVSTYAEILAAYDGGKAIFFKRSATSNKVQAATVEKITDGMRIMALESGRSIQVWEVNSSNAWTNRETITVPAEATDTTTGTIKLNPDQNVTLNADGQLEVGGRLGQTAEGGLYNPPSMNPTLVAENALLLSGMSGLSVANGALALLRGGSVTVKSAPAGTKEYHVSNTYANRLICAGLQTAGAVCIINEAAEPTGDFSTILSCTINGASFVPHTGADDPDNDIVIVVDKTCNPDSAVTQIRCYQAATKSSSFYSGQMVGGGSGLANVIVGQQVFSPSGNVVAMIAAQSYNTGNGNAILGRYHNVNKNRWLISGTGHDTTNGRSEAGAAVGQYSDISERTILAVGNGLNATNRSNAFEITDENNGTARVNFIETKNGKLEFADSQDLAPAVNSAYWGLSTGGSIVDYEGTAGFATTDVSGTAVNITAATGAVKPVTAGETLQWSFKARKKTGSETGKLQLNLLKCNASGGSTSNNIVHDGTAASYTTEWVTYTGTFTIPSGMEYVRPRFTRTNTGAGSAGGYEIKDFTLIQQVDSGVILKSPNGTPYKLVVADDGTLSTLPA